MTAVILEELTAGAADESEVKYWRQVRRAREQDGTLCTPNADDWWQVGKILNSLRRGLKSTKTGKIPKHSAGATERIIRDTLIARICKRENITLVTDNLKAFEAIRNYWPPKRRRKIKPRLTTTEAICSFSGGVDSLVGAVNLLASGNFMVPDNDK